MYDLYQNDVQTRKDQKRVAHTQHHRASSITLVRRKKNRLQEYGFINNKMNLDKKALELAVAGFFQHNHNSMPLQCPENRAERYSVREAFGGTMPYWVDEVRGARFAETLTSGILYRPQIVNEICHQIENALNSPVKEGVMIKGPQGIGKSHSLVNTVLKLQSTGAFLVTFLPDCDSWETTTYLVNAICASFGTSPGQLGIEGLRLSAEDLEALMGTIDIQLASLGKKWVFVFDQINKLFVKAINHEAKNASGLAFPFNMITQVRKRGRITSVISASANNEMAYKEHHEGFAEYIHSSINGGNYYMQRQLLPGFSIFLEASLVVMTTNGNADDRGL